MNSKKNTFKDQITLSQQNRKIKNCNIFNLPVGITCRPGVLCSKFCYSKKAEKMYPDVRPCRMRNYRASKTVTFVDDMLYLLKKSKYKITRIHESGDYHSLEYFYKWYTIACSLSDHKFYSYSKRTDIITKDVLKEKPKNFTLIYSRDGILKDGDVIPTENYGFDKIAIVTEHKTNCPSTSKNNWKVACVKQCQKCFDSKTKTILFARH